ncbi:glycoside hydrolase 43 family protein [Roseateles sp. BYS78W]|uniref:Glycoside hydrolase 43 family protein n=1 Tax=Pelomonas candidula TaxID=3299025 RepID=A0ABW7H903_9BURK
MRTRRVLTTGGLVLLCLLARADGMPPGVWTPDQRDGSYVNPVLAGDYSDPDVVRVGDDYYLTASSFTNVPGLPILHSRDLVNWTLIGHALARNVPEAHHATPRRGGGVWAPSIRHHGGRFVIYYPDPDFGIFMVSAADARGPWTPPVLVDATPGAIDPAPFWDDDGQGWLVFAYAASRAGFNNRIALRRLNAGGTHTEGETRVIVNADELPKARTSRGALPWFTTEGPKLYKRGGWYYVFAPSGSVKGGWQGVFRSSHIDGPYEARNVMDEGDSGINGPHQGAWVDTPSGQDWFLHFQDGDSYGRRVLLQPMRWTADGWPIIGEPKPGQTWGEPVARHRKPDLPTQPVAVPVVDDDFANGPHLGWQWSANPMDDWLDASVHGRLRLKSISSSANLWEAGQLLTQKLPGESFSATTRLSLAPRAVGERAGLLVMGYDYGWIGLENTADGLRLVQVTRLKADLGQHQPPLQQSSETVLTAPLQVDGPVHVRVSLSPVVVPTLPPRELHYGPAMLRSVNAQVRFSYSLDGVHFTPLGPGFTALPGRWVGTQIGLFAQAPAGTPAHTATRVGWAEFEFFRVTP